MFYLHKLNIQMTVKVDEDEEMEVSCVGADNGSELPAVDIQNRVIKTYLNLLTKQFPPKEKMLLILIILLFYCSIVFIDVQKTVLWGIGLVLG